MVGMRRREFVTLLGGAAAWPVAARAQEMGKRRIIGFLGSGTSAAQGPWVTAFLQRLRELGWIEGRNLTVEYRWAEGNSDRAAEFAAEFVRLHVDFIVTYANPMVLATYRSSSRRQRTRSAPASLRAWRGLAATSRAYRCSRPISLASIWNFCTTLFPVSAGWRSSSIPTILLPYWKCTRFRQRHARSALKLRHSKSGERRILRWPWRS